MYVVGLSGGIGSGKTVASDHFAELGVSVVDTDVIAREIVLPGQSALLALVEEFGESILQPSGELDRGELRSLAFASPEAKEKLDTITHPAIRRETVTQIEQAKSNYCLVVVPLLSEESSFREIMQRILVVTADTEIKIERVKKRSNLNRDEVLRIMATQLSDEQRLKFADDVIENNTSLQHVYDHVERLHGLYTRLASENQTKPA